VERIARIPVCLAIAGSDSGGGAGIQADLKAFARCGVHGTTAITAITAQNTVAVTRVEPVSAEMILAQVRAVVDDIGVDAVKIGMLGTVETIHAVAQALDHVPDGTPVVVDPVMVAESGARLLAPDAHEALVRLILPSATVVTPNVPEAAALAGAGVEDSAAVAGAGPDDSAAVAGAGPEDSAALARAVRELGPRCVVVTGGHRAQAIDVFFDGDQVVELAGERYPGGAAHGSGCTHSSALAAHLALGWTALEAARAAKQIAAAAVRDGLRDVGAGPGPVDVLGVAARTSGARRE
jgi:hydroxymethylpyrimidine/phosphomethylpyrimidine kinase